MAALTIAERVIECLKEATCIDEIRPEQNVIADLQFDSLDIVECVMSIEDEFGLRIDYAEWESNGDITVQQVIDYVAERKTK